MAKRTGTAEAPRAGVRRPEILDLTPANPDLQTAEQDGGFIREFLRSIGPFFDRAQSLESQARGTLTIAKALTAPTTMEEDERIQAFVKRTSAEKKQVLEHWTPTSVVYRFYKSLHAAQQRPVVMLDDANAIGNRLHNTFTDAEKRRASEEQDRIRREAEQRAEATRQQELAEAEAAAVKLEESSPILSDRERIFVDGKAMGLDDYKASARAGFSQPRAAAERLMKSQKIQDAIQAQRTANAIREQAAAKRAQPLDVQVEPVMPQISRSVGHDRTTHSAELLDERALINAVLAGSVPSDVLSINTTKLNEYARSLQDKINLWPGVRYKKTTKVI